MIENPMYQADPPEPVSTIGSLEELCCYFDADEPRSLNRRMYKDTDCGASISIYLPDGTAIHNGDKQWETLPIDTPIHSFTIQTIVEGSDAEVNSEPFVLPVECSQVEAWMEEMEAESSRLWDEANNDDDKEAE